MGFEGRSGVGGNKEAETDAKEDLFHEYFGEGDGVGGLEFRND